MGKTNTELQPLLINSREAAEILNIGKSLFYRLHSEGKIPAPTRLGARVLWSRDELERWVEAGSPNRQHWNALKKLV